MRNFRAMRKDHFRAMSKDLHKLPYKAIFCHKLPYKVRKVYALHGNEKIILYHFLRIA